jgi:gliding motility-associated-like protein
LKKLINILVFILLIGSFSDLSSQTYTRIGENNTQYTADQSTNHIFTMVKDGTYDPITINVSLNKVTFKNTSTNTNYGWGTGNDIPAAWDFEILTVSKTPSSISSDKHSFTYSGVPIVDVAITVRVFDGDGTVTGLAEVPITYRLEGIFALSSAEFIACSESLQIVMNEVDLGNNVKPCAGTSGDPKYNIKIYDAGTTDLVVEVTQLSNEFLIPLDVGDYDYVITDGCGRTFTSSYDITDAPEIGAEVIFAGKECFGDTDTKIVLRVQGAKRPLTWVLEKKNGDNWDPVYTSGNVGGNASSSADITAIGTGIFTLTVTGLIADGVYKYTFTDANECTKSTEFNIVTPSALSHLLIESDSATKRVLNCSGDVDGKLTFRGSGGWTQPFDGNFINPTNWGSGYTFTLVNADTGGDVAVVNASTWFDYARNDSNQQIGWEAVFDNLPPGNYKLKLKESVATDNQVDPNVAYGCEVLFDDIYTISAPALLVVTTDVKNDISCFGDNNGSIDLIVSGGTPTYTYAWTKVGDASYSATTKDVNGLSPGTYNVEVKDSKDCIITKTYTIVEPVLLEVSIDNPSSISCYGNNVGTIKANITQGSTSPYVYVLTGTDYNGGNVTVTSASTAATSYEFTGLLAGTEYKVTITDSNGCSKVTDAKIITQPDSGLTVTGTVKADVEKTINGDGIHMLCNGGTNGEIDLTVSGGNSPYNFAWTAVSGTGLNATAEDQTGLTAGVYNVTVTDSSGDCSVSRTYIVSDPAPLTIPVGDIPDGTPDFTLIGEFETSKYYLSNASLTYMEARDIAANLGGYLVSIKTQLENQWLIDNSPDQNFWLGLDDIRDESKVDGVVDKTKYRWNDGTSLDWQGFPGSEPNDNEKNTTTNFAGEDYIEFSNGSWNDIYHYVKRKFVIEFNPSQIPDFNGSSISCFGGNNASIDFVVTGGTTDYTYNWTVVSGGTGTNLVANQKSQTLLTAGVYKVVVTDASGCTISTTYTITEPSELLIADATVSTAIACFGDNETIKVNVTQGSTAPYIYSVSGSATETSAATTATTYSFSVPVGTYTVKVTDANGCEKSLDPITLTQSAAALAVSGVVKPYIGGFQVSCNGASDGEIDTTVTGGTIGLGYTYAWSVTGGGTDISASTSADQLDLKAGTYTVVVTDANGCTQTDSYTLTEPDVLTVSGVVKQYIGGIQVSCNGANDGEIDTTVAGGATDYTYAWSVTGGGTDISASTSADQLDLKAGTYTVVVTDANGCDQTDSYTLTQPDALSLDSSQVDFNGFNVSCFGALNGEIDLTVTGGTPVYTYEWSSSDGTGYDPTSQDQTDLSSGTYIVKVTDSNNCEISGTFVVAEPPPLVLTATLSDFNGFNISCNAGNDGIIDITSTGGLLVTGDNYTYAWTQSNGGSGVDASSEDQTGLTVGTYTVLITDSNDCTITKSYQIVEPDLIGFTGVKSDYNGYGVSTAGNNNGTITITSSGGSGGNTYDWSTDDGSGIVVGDQNQNTLTAGTYILKITDSNGCNITKSFTLTEPAELLISLGTDPTNILCYGDSTGLIKAIITQAAVPPYTFTLNGENYLGEIVFESFSNITDLNYTFNVKAGEYSITVTDLNGSTKTTNTRVYTQPDAPLSISETISVFNDYNISCTGALDGAIDITVSGGTLTGTNYTYSWTSSVGSSDLTGTRTAEDQTGLGTGEYTVIVTDEGACTITKSFVLTEPEKIVYSLNNKTDITCFGDNDGSIEISVSKGTGVYVYEWTLEGVVVNKNDTTSLKNLGPGVYNLKLTDGCEILSFNYKIVEPELLTVTLDQKIDILCFGDSTGEISVTVAGGISPYNYEWIDNFGNKYNRDIGNVFNKGDLSNIPIGIYDLTVTDKNGCIATLKTELTQPDDLVINFDKTDLNCYEQNDGTIKITPTGGVAPYTYKWNDFGNGPERTNLSAGIYTVNVTDKNLCEKTIDIEIIQAPLFNIVPVITPVTCFGADDGTITLNIEGGEDPISVTWADDASAGDSRTNLKPGNYNVILNDGSGCVIERTFQILEPEELRLSSVLSDAIDCDNPLSGSIDLQVIGGNPPYSFLWSNGETTEDLTDIGANNYKVTVTDSKGCKVVETFVIKRQLDLEVKLDTSLRIVCESREVYQVNNLTISGGVFPYKVKWSDGIVLNVPGDKAEIMETKTEGAYQVEVTDFLGCTKTILFDVVLPKLGFPDFDYTSFYLQEFNALTFNDPITFSNLSTENYLSVEWDFGDGTTSSLNNPTHTYTETGSYDVTIYVTYVGGCVYELTKTIYIGESYELELPNAFTPNGDGLNDTFRPVYYGFTEIVLKVFDTWGTLIYFEKAEKGKMNGWNGTINTRPAENGNYIYQVSGKTFNGELVYKNGPFTLLR